MKVIHSPAHSQPPSAACEVTSYRNGRWEGRVDTLAAEEPLEIRLAGCSVAVTMRTPGDDVELALGFLYTEGIIRGRDDVASVAHCPEEGGDTALGNVINVNPADPTLVDPARWQRNFFSTSSCGLCGKASIAAVRQDTSPIRSELRVSGPVLTQLDNRLRQAQAVFGQTGGLHAAGLFDGTGHLLVAREDIGRHNAVDKVIGRALMDGLLPLREHILLVSGRASFEVSQKALIAGIPFLAAVSAPSNLAVDLAREGGMTLVGFLRGERFNVYSGEERIVPEPNEEYQW